MNEIGVDPATSDSFGRTTPRIAGRSPQDHLRAATDDTLTTLVREQNIEAFGQLYHRHHRDAHRYASRLTRRHLGRDAAEDVVAEAMSKVLAALLRGRGPSDGFRAYLFTAIRTVTFTESMNPNAQFGDAGDERHSLPSADENVDTSVAMAAFASLPERWRKVLWTTEALKIPVAEAAPLLDMQASGIAMLAMRAREALRIAYVRQHLPNPLDRNCHRALDLIARRPVVDITVGQSTFLDDHLAGCAGCSRAATQIGEEVGTWARLADSTTILQQLGADRAARSVARRKGLGIHRHPSHRAKVVESLDDDIDAVG